ncbi:TPA: hypothetical protein ACX96U_001181 [Clostridium sporogenes]|uniref:hypothetical protein n=1 Tax=Clostridium sporogenes TaxID=1509 RepID=UPI000717A83F|nr:hypothetical protein [Clostridium sporogenes]KRU40618.1 hypothetical protein VT94_22860 [Clostridium sporogenes]MBY7066503.1 hypothetical protein [Clostridium sporogenes]MBY7069177.1 hypothetical protein [Clostridium sporogenes]MDU6337444.1 hypothetical protein [Clostridium sporogenes]NFQ01675.1 hypothetical protein [Clostridium sporogenes]
MNKLTKTEIRKNLKIIEEELNNREEWELENGCVEYRLFLNREGNLNFIILGDVEDDKYENYTIELEDYDVKTILKSMINYIYENEINYRNNYIRKTKSFNSRKIKSLTLWLERSKQDKVNKINEELAERYKTTKMMENRVEEYKDYIRDLYSCLSVLCPDWKAQDIKSYVFNKLKESGFTDFSMTMIDGNTINITKYNDKDEVIKSFNIVIDTYSNKNIILNIVRNMLKEAA